MDSFNETLNHILEQQKLFFRSGTTKDYTFRYNQLTKLKQVIVKYEKQIAEALFLDLHKSHSESELTEIKYVLSEIDATLRNLRRWMRPRYVLGSVATFPSLSKVITEPYGQVLIISPWNYPFQLLVAPLIGAMAAGNVVVLKPSPQSFHTTEILQEIISEAFSDRYIALFKGDVKENQEILAHPFDYIFFTGGSRFGSYVASCAARYFTPLTLELGGKSPCIVDRDADIGLAAKRITWGKLLNAGQTCVAPDYVLIHASRKTEFLKALKCSITEFFGPNPQISESYPRIISKEATERLKRLLTQGNILYGGTCDPEERYCAPTIIDEADLNSELMQEEIFGPILPVVTFSDVDEAIRFVNERPKPLALYYFGKKRGARLVTEATSSGAICINDTIMQLANRHLPFGGVGNSGYGKYHGKYSFEIFSHLKSWHRSFLKPDLKFRYAPYIFPKWLQRSL